MMAHPLVKDLDPTLPTTSASDTVAPATGRLPYRPDKGKLLQVLGVGFGIAVAVGNSISVGIVRTPGSIAAILPNAWLFLAVWIGGALYALLSAFQLAELGTLIPSSGGQYNFSRRALGEYAGFIVGWSDWISTCGTTGAVGIVLGEYLAHLFPVLDGALRIKIVGVSAIVLFALLQWKSVTMGSKVQNFTTVLKGLAFFVMVIACFTMGRTAHAEILSAPGVAVPVGAALITAILLGMQATIYTYDGWDAVIYFGDEVRNPGYLIPRAIFASLGSLFVIYLFINAAVLYVLPMREIAGNDFALGLAAQRVFGQYGDAVFRSVIVVALFSSINALHLMGTRVIYAMSRDRLFFHQVTHVNKGGTPTIALLLSALVGVIFAIGKFERVIAMLAFFFVTNYMLSFISLFLLRARNPQARRPYRAWGYPWTTALALLGSIAFLIEAVREDRVNSLFTLVALACSYPVFRILKAVSSREPSVSL
jgi:APA family basic amino acid/polyamine antiporter